MQQKATIITIKYFFEREKEIPQQELDATTRTILWSPIRIIHPKSLPPYSNQGFHPQLSEVN